MVTVEAREWKSGSVCGVFGLWTLPEACRDAGRCPVGILDATQNQTGVKVTGRMYREQL
jgi:hypothetical protein